MHNKFLNLLGLAKRAGKVSVGYNNCEEVLLRGKSSLIIVSDELAANSLKKFKNNCEKNNVPIIEGISSEALTQLLGRDKIIKVVSVNGKGFSRKLSELWIENKHGGDHID